MNFLKKIKFLFQEPITLITHSGKFHVDDIFACATLQLILDKKNIHYKVIRTRDESIITSGDYVFDVGGIYDPSINRFDHHQPTGAGVRTNGIPYASFGLVWKHFGNKLSSEEIAQEIDVKIASGIDALDNGISITKNIYPDVFPIDFGDIASSFKPSWKNVDESGFDKGFLEIVAIAKKFLEREIIYLEELKEAEQLVERAYQNASDKRIVTLDQYSPGKSKLAMHPEPLFVIYPNTTNNTWMANTVRENESEFINRKDFPAEWAGLRDQELAQISGVEDAIFCHKGLFLIVAKSREGVLSLVKKSLQS
jgi:uncharacterized UPF0160 family protein